MLIKYRADENGGMWAIVSQGPIFYHHFLGTTELEKRKLAMYALLIRGYSNGMH